MVRLWCYNFFDFFFENFEQRKFASKKTQSAGRPQQCAGRGGAHPRPGSVEKGAYVVISATLKRRSCPKDRGRTHAPLWACESSQIDLHRRGRKRRCVMSSLMAAFRYWATAVDARVFFMRAGSCTRGCRLDRWVLESTSSDEKVAQACVRPPHGSESRENESTR